MTSNTLQGNLIGSMMDDIFHTSSDNFTVGLSQSKGIINTGEYIWEIYNFWERLLMQSDMSLQVNLSGMHWLHLDNENNQKIKFYIIAEKIAEKRRYNFAYRISVKTKDGIKCLKSDCILESIKVCREKCNIILHTISMANLSENKEIYFLENIFTIYFEFKWCTDVENINLYRTISQSYTNEESTKSDKIPNDADKDNSDENTLVTFVIDNKRLYANKKIICQNSKAFKAMFYIDMKEKKEKEVRISDVKYDIMEFLLSYLQLNTLPDMDKFNIERLSELLLAAEKYDVQDLKLKCEFQLIRLVKTTNCVEILNSMSLNCTTHLNDYVQKIIELDVGSFNSRLTELIKTKPEYLLHFTMCRETKPTLCYNIQTHKDEIKNAL